MTPQRAIRLVSVVAVLLAALLAPALAAAQYGAQPVPYARRPLTLPDATLRFDLPLIWTIVDDDEAFYDDRDTLEFMGGLGAGITSDFQIDAQVLPYRFTRPSTYAPVSFWQYYLGAPALGLTWRFARGDFEAGLRGDFLLPVNHEFGAQIGVPMLVRLGEIMRLDTGPYLLLYFTDDPSTRIMAPLSLAINVSPTVFLGPETGLVIWDGDYVEIPFGFFVGVTIRGTQNPVVDLRGRIRTVDIDDDGPLQVWQLDFSATIFAYL